MKFNIKIDRNSIRKNPNAGRTTYKIPGIKQEFKDEVTVRKFVRFGENQSWQQISVDKTESVRTEIPIQVIHSLSPEPDYLYNYAVTEITCLYCGNVFPHTDLKEEFVDGYWDPEIQDQYYWDYYKKNICPSCGSTDCCELEFEKLSDVQELKIGY